MSLKRVHSNSIFFVIGLIFFMVLSLSTEAQSGGLTDDQARDVAINAANQAIPGLGQPYPRSRDGWTWSVVILNNIRDTALGCALVQGTPFTDPIEVYAISLYYGDAATYVVHVARDGRVQLCDAKFPGIGQATPGAPTSTPLAFSCQAVTNTVIATYPTPQIVGTGNFSLPAGTYDVRGRNAENTWVLLVLPTAPPGNYWIPRNSVATSVGDGCAIVPIVADSPNATPISPAFDCIANVVAGTPTYPSPAVSIANYTVPAGPYGVLGRNVDETWVRIALPAGLVAEYWIVRTAVTSFTGTACETLPIFTQAVPFGTATPAAAACNLSPRGEYANIRSAPSTEADQLDRIQQNTLHPVLGRNGDETWYRIQQGWVLFSVVVLSGQCGNLPQVDGATDLESVQPVTGVDTGYVCDFSNALYLQPRIRSGRATARVESGGLPNNLRQEPDTSAPSVGTAQPGRTFDQVLFGPACNQGFVWWYVEIDGARGWTVESSGRDNEYFIEPVPGFEADTQSPPAETGNVLNVSATGVRFVAFDPSGDSRLAVVDSENVVSVWNVANTAAPPSLFPLDAALLIGDVEFLSLSEIAYSTSDGAIYIAAPGDDAALREISSEPSLNADIDVSADNALLAKGGCAEADAQNTCLMGEATLYNIADGGAFLTITGHENAIYAVRFNPDVRFLATAGNDEVRLWSVDTGDLLRTFDAPSAISAMAFDPETTRLAVASCAEFVTDDFSATCVQAEVRIWDIVDAETEQVITLAADEATGFIDISTLAFSPDGTRLAYAGSDNNVYIWDVNTQALVDTLAGHTGAVNTLSFNGDGTMLASGSADGTVRLWMMEIESFG